MLASRWSLSRTTLLILIAAAVFAPSIVGRELAPPDEPRFALIARQMFESSNWIELQRFSRPYLDKPPLMFWLQGVAFACGGGPSEWAARLPLLLATLALTGVFYREARRWVGETVATHAVLIWLASPLVLARGAWGATDPLLALFVFASLAALRRASEGQAWAGPVAAAMIALGTMTKGPVAVLWVGLACLASWLAGAEWWSWRPLLRPASLLSFVLIALPWPILYATRQGLDAPLAALWKQNGTRFLHSWDNPEAWWYFGPLLIGGLLPWSLALLPSALVSAWREPRARAWLLLTAGALLFFSIPHGKRGVYLLPAFPWLALMIARGWHQERQQLWLRRIAASATGLIGVALIAACVLAPTLARRWRMPFAESARDWLLPIFGVIAVSLIVTAIGLARGRRDAVAIPALGLAVLGLITPFTVTPMFNQIQDARRGAARLAQAIPPGVQVGLTDTKPELIAWYGNLHDAVLLGSKRDRYVFLTERPARALILKCVEAQPLLARIDGARQLATERIGRAEMCILLGPLTPPKR